MPSLPSCAEYIADICTSPVAQANKCHIPSWRCRLCHIRATTLLICWLLFFVFMYQMYFARIPRAAAAQDLRAARCIFFPPIPFARQHARKRGAHEMRVRRSPNDLLPGRITLHTHAHVGSSLGIDNGPTLRRKKHSHPPPPPPAYI